MTYAGGVIGYLGYRENTSEQINGSFSVNCTVSGHDNVGGIIGFNAGGKIDKVAFGGIIAGDGENIGGIVGCNTGGNITNCTNTNKVTINTTGKNVGGIVGLNSDKDITNCKNEAKVKGNKNVGGIAGLTYKGKIEDCGNQGEVEGTENSVIGQSINSSDLKVFYNIAGENATGVGGIAGKIHGTEITCSYNNKEITCNFNGGGIVGVAARGTIQYSYNKGKVTNEKHKNEDFVMNRLGGICGAGAGIIVKACYNIGEVNGFGNEKSTPLKSPVGGIVGLLVDNTWWIGTTEYKLGTKYLDISIKTLTTYNFKNELSYCYNAGNIKGDYSNAKSTTHYNGGIIGFIAWGLGSDDIVEKIKKATDFVWDWITNGEEIKEDDTTTIEECYYKTSSDSDTVRGTNNLTKKDKGEGKTRDELKNELYIWTTDDVCVDDENSPYFGNLIYNPTAPLETGKGYEGYGVLWWEILDYQRLETNMFLCAKSENDDLVSYRNFRNTAFEQKIYLTDSTSINYDELNFLNCRIPEEKVGTSPVGSISDGCYRYIMMVPKGEYTIKPRTNADEETKSKLYNGNEYKNEDTTFSVNIESDTTLWIAYIFETKTETFTPSKWSFEFEKRTELTPEGNWYVKKKDDSKYKNAYIEYDPNDSIARTSKGFNGGYVLLDKPAVVPYRVPSEVKLYHKVLLKYYGPFDMPRGEDNRIYGSSTTTMSKTENEVNAKGNAYVEFGSLSDKGVSTETSIYNAEIELRFDVDMKWDGNGQITEFFNKIFGDNGEVKFNCTLEKFNGTNWTTIHEFRNKNFEVPTKKPKESDAKDRLQSEDRFNYKTNKRYVATFSVSSAFLNDSIKGTKADEKLRLKMNIENKDDEKVIFYFKSAKLTVEYGTDGM